MAFAAVRANAASSGSGVLGWGSAIDRTILKIFKSELDIGGKAGYLSAMKKISAVMSLLAVVFSSNYARAQAPAVKIQFVNATHGEKADSDIWINFSEGGAAVVAPGDGKVSYNSSLPIGTANIKNDTGTYVLTPIHTNSSYPLDTIQHGEITISTFGGGRAYASYGAGLSTIASGIAPKIGPYPGWQPAPTAPSNPPDPTFTQRFQAFELTIQPTVEKGSNGLYGFSNENQAYADLSYIDQVGISTGIKVVNPPAGTKNPIQTSRNTQTLFNAVQIYGSEAAGATTLTALTNVVTKAAPGKDQYCQVAGSDPTIPYYNPGSTSIANPPSNTSTAAAWNVVRVVGPGPMPPESDPAKTPGATTVVYHTWDDYLLALTPTGSLNTAGNLVTNLAGSYGETGDPAQHYTASATFNAGSVTLGGIVYTGYVLIDNFTWGNTQQTKLYVPFSVLKASTGLYGTNPTYSVGGGALVPVPPNDLQTRVVGDVVAGMNFGLVGSTVVATYDGKTQALADFTSKDWWRIGVQYPNLLFGGAQPTNPTFYNTYAAKLQFLTSGYGFGIQDRLGANTTEFNVTLGDGSNPTLQFLIQPDIAVPCPSDQGCCPGDLDGDGEVTSGDVGFLLLSAGPCPGCLEDLDGDGEVGAADVSFLLLSFGPCS